MAARTPDELTAHGYWVLARLKSGATLPRAREEMPVIAARTAEQDPMLDTGWKRYSGPLSDEEASDSLRLCLIVLQLAVGFVLLIARANVANLLLIRAAGRERESAIRSALGATRGRLARQMLVESLLVGVAGGAGGLRLGAASLPVIVAWSHTSLETLQHASVDPAVVGCTIAVTLVRGILFGLAPVAHSVRQDMNHSLKQGGRAGHRAVAAGTRHRGGRDGPGPAHRLGPQYPQHMAPFLDQPGFPHRPSTDVSPKPCPGRPPTQRTAVALCRQLADRLSAPAPSARSHSRLGSADGIDPSRVCGQRVDLRPREASAQRDRRHRRRHPSVQSGHRTSH